MTENCVIKCIKHIRDTYGVEVYLEPGEAIALNAGYLVTEVMDIVENGLSVLILDASAACHMPDVLEMPYRPPLKDSGNAGEKHYLPSFLLHLSGGRCDRGLFPFDRPLHPGDRVVFEDMALYTMVKTNTFNGMALPSIAWRDESGRVSLVKSFGYEDFKGRLS